MLLPAIVLGCLACAGAAKLAPVDLDGGGWTRWSGQAVWRPGADRPPIAGEVILARHENGDVFVNFSKPPLSIFTARTAGSRWNLELIDRGRSHSGRGRPPKRFVWFRLPDLLAGGRPPDRWRVERKQERRWDLRREDGGESIRLVLDR